MATRKPPTERQRRLGAELRKMREHVGLTLGEAADVHRTDKATLSNSESGRYGVSPDRVRVWAANYSCPDGDYVDALAEMAREGRSQRRYWWEDHQGDLPAAVLDLAELEHHATALRSVQYIHMPGLLQHEDYARAVFAEAVPSPRPDDFERKLRFRMERARTLDEFPDRPCTFIVHEAALRMRFGNARVVRAQLAHLLAQSERRNVTVRVLLFAAGGFPSAGDQAVYARGPVERLDTVQKDTPTGSVFLNADTHLANYRVILDRMEQRALAPGPSRDFVHEVARRV